MTHKCHYIVIAAIIIEYYFSTFSKKRRSNSYFEIDYTYVNIATQCAEGFLNKIAKAINETFPGLKLVCSGSEFILYEILEL